MLSDPDPCIGTRGGGDDDAILVSRVIKQTSDFKKG